MPHDERHHPAAARAERRAHTDFVRPLRNRIGNYAEDADAREQERDAAEGRDQPRAQAIGAKGLASDVLNGSHVRQPLTARRISRAAAGQFRWAPHGGSGTIPSITPSLRRSGAVMRRTSAASLARLASSQRIAAHPSGEITE